MINRRRKGKKKIETVELSQLNAKRATRQEKEKEKIEVIMADPSVAGNTHKLINLTK